MTIAKPISFALFVFLCQPIGQAVAQTSTNRVNNGGFVQYVPQLGAGGGWSATGVSSNFFDGWQGEGGNPGAYYALNSGGSLSSDPTLAQMISGLDAGQQYEITGDFVSNYLNEEPADACCSFQVEFDGFIVFEAGPGPLGVWREFRVAVQPTSTTALLRLRAETQGTDNDFGIDNIRLFDSPLCQSRADLNIDGVLDNGDIFAFVDFIFAGDLTADINGDGINDNGDIIAFVQLFLAGC